MMHDFYHPKVVVICSLFAELRAGQSLKQFISFYGGKDAVRIYDHTDHNIEVETEMEVNWGLVDLTRR